MNNPPLVPDNLWEAIEPLLPKEPPKPRGGRPRVPARAALAGIIFVLRTGCDALAIACGTSHGAYKFTRQPDGDILAMHVIEAIHERLPQTHLVMHGSSSVPQHLQDLLNRNGGVMPQTWGVPVEEIERGIPAGSQSPTRTPSVESVVDRGDAIERAVAMATGGDVVLIAGKGHEKYQQIGDRVLPFDDGEVARAALTKRRGRR